MKESRRSQVAGRKSQVGVPSRGRPQVAPTRVELHIGELALHGFDRVDPAQIRTSVRSELERLLIENGTPSSFGQGGDVAHLEGEAFTAASSANAGAIGAQIARAIYRGLGQ